VIEVTDLVKRYGTHTVLGGASFTIEDGQIATILGRSGCGKSTLLRCLNRLEQFERGRIGIGDVEILGAEERTLSRAEERALTRRVRARVGMVFQNLNLFPHLTVMENCIEAPRVVKRLARAEAEAIARRYLERVELSDKIDAYPAQLSGGQQQRVAIARALAMEPDVMLFDEPTSALDPQLVDDVARLLRDLHELRKTLVVVSHDLGFARRISDRVIYLEDGRVVESGTVEDVFNAPRHPETQAFVRGLS